MEAEEESVAVGVGGGRPRQGRLRGPAAGGGAPAAGGRGPPPGRAEVMKQILRALAFMHGERIMHKDLKPQNVMLVGDAPASAGCSVKVIDFGLAELFGGDRTVSSSFGGAPPSRAPARVSRAPAPALRVPVLSAPARCALRARVLPALAAWLLARRPLAL